MDTVAGPALPPAVLLYPGRRFSRCELRAMALDGLVERVFEDAFIATGTAVTDRVRAAALGLSIPANIANRAVLGRLSAAWVYGCAPAPERVALLVDAGHRIGSLRPWRGYVLHEVQLGPFDVLELQGCRITTPLRTAVDLALHVPYPAGLDALRRLAQEPALRCPPPLIRAALLAQYRVPNKKDALARLEACS